jgi:shikimate kinase
VIVLIGPPGAGKTRIGQTLGARLGWPFVDTDHMVAARAGMEIAEIFAVHGEPAFRMWEREAVRNSIGGGAPRVVALGGGAPMDPATASLLAGQFTVFLDVSDAVGVRRVGLSGARPLLAASPRARWRELMAQRRPTYTRLATSVVATDTEGPAGIAERIAKLWADYATPESSGTPEGAHR